MELRLRKYTAEAIGFKAFIPYGLNKDSWDWKEETDIDLVELSREKIDDLRKLFEDHSEVKGTQSLINDIDTWLNALHDPAGVWGAKAKGPRQLCPLLIAAIGANPRHHLYFKNVEVADSYLVHYVEEIEYHPRRQERDRVIPEHTTIDIWSEEFLGHHEKHITFWAEDCRGISVQEALARKGFYQETYQLRKRYLAEIKRWSEITKLIGRQFLAYGKANDRCDGNPDKEDSWWRSYDHEFVMAKTTGPSKVLIDVFKEVQDKNRRDDYDDNIGHLDKWFWTLTSHKKLLKQVKGDDKDSNYARYSKDSDDEELLEDLDVETPEIEVPIHPYLCVFDLKKHLRLRIHVSYLADYKFDKTISDRLILPKETKDLVTMLIEHEEAKFQDIVEGKSGGAVVLLTGKPGVGKTLTAEVYAEAEERGLYSVQCSQLGTDPEELEEALLKVFTRAQRWGAVLLLDEADVYVRQRGSDLHQNAIVGVFLRVLEYQANVLFLTTNRPDDVDDAIASRCVARLNYKVPTPEDQKKIWRVLADASNIRLDDLTIETIVVKSHDITGRDVKNLLKLANLVAISRGEEITPEMVEFAKKFKPTV